MLVITRRRGERIIIGNDIEVVVTDITRRGVRLGIAAPRSTEIVRGEVREAVELANQSAARSDLDLPDGVDGLALVGEGVSALAVMGVKSRTLGMPLTGSAEHDGQTGAGAGCADVDLASEDVGG